MRYLIYGRPKFCCNGLISPERPHKHNYLTFLWLLYWVNWNDAKYALGLIVKWLVEEKAGAADVAVGADSTVSSISSDMLKVLRSIWLYHVTYCTCISSYSS